ncbi:MAG: TolB family protein, partial [Acidobacteriota bacterium]
MSRPSAPALCLAASGLLLGALGVSIPWTPAMAPSGDGAMIVTQAPARGRAGPPSASPAPWDRYPPGSRIVLVDPTGHSPRVRVLSGSLPAAGAPDVSPEADAVVFTGLPRNEAGWHIYEADLSGHRLLRITRSGRDCTDPAYLAGGRIVASCANGPPEPARTAPATWSLHVIERATGDMRRITFGPGSALDPTPLRDGRILFSLQQGPGTGRPAGGIA